MTRVAVLDDYQGAAARHPAWATLPEGTEVVFCFMGGDPDRPSSDATTFHRFCRENRGGLNATSTHDSKRNEDARCRLAVLSETSDSWGSLTERWHRRFVSTDGALHRLTPSGVAAFDEQIVPYRDPLIKHVLATQAIRTLRGCTFVDLDAP